MDTAFRERLQCSKVNPPLTFYEFFAGGGMARLGLGSAWRCTFANEWCEKKAASYRSYFGGDELKVDDVANLTVHDLPGAPNLVWASFPCQDLSLAGAGSGLAGERSGTFRPFWKLIREMIAAGVVGAHREISLQNRFFSAGPSEPWHTKSLRSAFELLPEAIQSAWVFGTASGVGR